MWWVLARGRLPVLPIIGEPNGGPFYFNFSRGAFVVLLAISFVLAFAQGWGGLADVDRQALGSPAPVRVAAGRGSVLVRLRPPDPTVARHRSSGPHGISLAGVLRDLSDGQLEKERSHWSADNVPSAYTSKWPIHFLRVDRIDLVPSS